MPTAKHKKSHRFPPRWLGLGRVGFVVDKAALGQVFCEYSGSDCSKLITIQHQGLVQQTKQ
jgi:hypothetical protein